MTIELTPPDKTQQMLGVAHLVSRLLAPAGIISACCWLWFESFLCWGGYPSDFQILACRYSFVVPIAVTGTLVIVYLWFLRIRFTMLSDSDSARSLSPVRRLRLTFFPGSARRPGSIAGADAGGPFGIEWYQDRTVRQAHEMFFWSIVTSLAVLHFYLVEGSNALGWLVLLIMLRAAYFIGRTISTSRDIGRRSTT